MSDSEKTIIHLPGITRVEGHCAVEVEIVGTQVRDVKLNVFEGARFFEQLVVGHNYEEIPHITSRVCAICSTGHLIAAASALESIFNYHPPAHDQMLRELMHLGMIIESHSTHIYALALPDFVGAETLMDFAGSFPDEFAHWTQLRNLGSAIQTTIGGRPFHPVTLQVGGFSIYPDKAQLQALAAQLENAKAPARETCGMLLGFAPASGPTTRPCYAALVPAGTKYGFFGNRLRTSDGWEEPIANYREYISERALNYSHAKRTQARGNSFMVGAMARLALFADRLSPDASSIYELSPISKGDHNTIWNNLAQAIELVEAIDRSIQIINTLIKQPPGNLKPIRPTLTACAGEGVGAIECPRGTLYHYYKLDDRGNILSSDMVTPSAQNTARIEQDIREIVSARGQSDKLQQQLETLVRAYDPCNTCATHMVSVRYGNS